MNLDGGEDEGTIQERTSTNYILIQMNQTRISEPGHWATGENPLIASPLGTLAAQNSAKKVSPGEGCPVALPSRVEGCLLSLKIHSQSLPRLGNAYIGMLSSQP